MPRLREDWFEAEQLILAASDGDLAEVQKLHAAGFDLDLMDELSKAAVHHAAENGHYKVAHWLLQNGASVDLHDEEMIGETPLNLAARKNYPEMVELLLGHGANPDVNGWMGFTARIRAQARRDEDGLRIAALIEKYKPATVNPRRGRRR
jgi:ankyrin repeat protein